MRDPRIGTDAARCNGLRARAQALARDLAVGVQPVTCRASRKRLKRLPIGDCVVLSKFKIVRQGFIYERAPHITLKTIANARRHGKIYLLHWQNFPASPA